MKMLGLATRHALPFLLLVPAAALAATPAGESPVIELPEQSPRHREIVLHEQWRIGAGDDDPVLGPIIDAVADPAGNVYLLDMQQQVLMKFSPEGQYLGPVARRGEGPGGDRARLLGAPSGRRPTGIGQELPCRGRGRWPGWHTTVIAATAGADVR